MPQPPNADAQQAPAAVGVAESRPGTRQYSRHRAVSARHALRALALGSLTWLAAGCSEAKPEGFPEADLIIISLDTLRADAVGALGGPPGISPTLDRLAAESVVFTRARAQAPQTAPSHMTLFTSTYPSVHGVVNMTVQGAQTTISPLPDDIPTLAEVLSAAGFESLALTDGGNLHPGHGFARGFDEFVGDLGGVRARVDQVVERAAELWPSPERTFLFWHTYEVHAPYVPPPEYLHAWTDDDYEGVLRERAAALSRLDLDEQWARVYSDFWKGFRRFEPDDFAYLHSLYRGGVRYTDDVLAELVEALAETGALDTSVLVVLSDHGEEFGEHGEREHHQVYEECLRVPLMVRLPGGLHGGARIETPVGLVDVMPTVLELLGIDTTGLALQGRSLADAVLGGVEPEPRPMISEFRRGADGEDWAVAVLQGEHKYLVDSSGTRRVFDLAADPGETRDVSAEDPDRARRFEAFLTDWRASMPRRPSSSAPIELAPETLDELSQLGYVEGR